MNFVRAFRGVHGDTSHAAKRGLRVDPLSVRAHDAPVRRVMNPHGITSLQADIDRTIPEGTVHLPASTVACELLRIGPGLPFAPPSTAIATVRTSEAAVFAGHGLTRRGPASGRRERKPSSMTFHARHVAAAAAEATTGATLPERLAFRCFNCGSRRLDANLPPRGGEIVQCLHCREWNRYAGTEPPAP